MAGRQRSVARFPNGRERGAVLLLTLGFLAALVGIISVIAANHRVDMRARANRSRDQRAQVAAEAGIQRALAELQLYVQGGQTSTSLITDAWATLGDFGRDNFVIDNGSFRVEIVDASSLINLNTATQAHLERLPMTTEQVDSLLDWRSAGQDPRPEGGKDQYYNNLEQPYNAKLRRLDSVDELLMVKGFTARAIYEPQQEFQSSAVTLQGPNDQQPALADIVTTDSVSGNLTPDGQAKLSVNTATAAQMVQRGVPQNVAAAIVQRRNTQGTFTRFGDVLAVNGVNQQNAGTLIDNLWINGNATVEGRVNINTATEPVLNSLPGIQPDVAAAIASRQNSGFTSLSELLSVPGVTLQTLQQTIDLLTSSSQTFLIRVIGTAGATSASVQATVQIDQTGVTMLKLEQMPFNDMWSLWKWDESPSNETIVSEGK